MDRQMKACSVAELGSRALAAERFCGARHSYARNSDFCHSFLRVS